MKRPENANTAAFLWSLFTYELSNSGWICADYRWHFATIVINQYNLNMVKSTSWHQKIGVVMQDSFFFNMTIKENLLLANLKAMDTEVFEACKKAYIHDFIESLPEKYDTPIGEKGVKLSGGQKQRLAIARVLLQDPEIFIFDEATSSLDHESEKMIHRTLQELGKDKTVIIVAHRLTSILLADRVIVVEDGQIVGEDTHQKLRENNEVYQALFSKQYEGVS